MKRTNILELLQSQGDTPANIKTLLQLIKGYPDETILSWAGYSSKRQFEDLTDERFTRRALLESNYDDIIDGYITLG